MTNELFETDANEVASIETVRSYAQLEKFLAEQPEDTIYTVQEVAAAVANIKNNKGKNRGTLAGIPVSEMTLEQVKIELRNANSVLYKSKKRNADAELISKHEERVAAAKARLEELKPSTPVDTEEAASDAEGVYTEQEALEEL